MPRSRLPFAFLAAAVLAVALAAPAVGPARAEQAAPEQAAPEQAAPAILAPGLTADLLETKLLFGLASADGSGVSEQEWARFLAEEVTTRFPDGLTVIAAYGQVKGEAHGTAQVVQENMRLVLIYHPDTPEAAARLAEIRRLYSQRFHQWGVLQVTNRVKAAL